PDRGVAARVHVRLLEDGREEERADARVCVHARRRRRVVRLRRHADREPRQARHAAASPLLQLLRVRLVVQRDRAALSVAAGGYAPVPPSTASAAAWSAGVAAATIAPPPTAARPFQSVTTAPAPSRIGISGMMS